MIKKRILVLCTGNSCRSQIAEGYLKYFGSDKVDVFSAGIEAHGVNPKAIWVMKEDDIDISNQTSNSIEDYLGIDFDFVITVCDNAKESCPVFPPRFLCGFLNVSGLSWFPPAPAVRRRRQNPGRPQAPSTAAESRPADRPPADCWP